ncbi:PorP/SprF family type IX secretion system membrane protein [Phaeodactylibacter luteus]|nr:type IX secretion system membrane protein PorP/SprF [Phaeodactylibacter luteus]
MQKSLILLPLLFLLLTGGLRAQDPVFSQFFAAPMQINPAFAGTTSAPRVTANYRSQWAEYEGGYQTYGVSYEQGLPGLNSGFGVMVMGDDAGNGIYSTNRFHGVYGYQVRINRTAALRIGIEAGLIQSSLDWDKLVFLDQLDPINGPGGGGGAPMPTEEQRPDNLNNTVLDIGAGVLINNERAYAGLSLKHLNSPDESLLDINENLGAGLPLRITLHGGFEIPLIAGNNQNKGAFVSPNVLLVKQGEFAQIDGGAYFGVGSFFGGAWYRHTFNNSDAAIAMFGMRYGVFRFGYSFDITLNGLTLGRTGGTHELSLTVNFEDSQALQKKRFNSRYNNCFKMFN